MLRASNIELVNHFHSHAIAVISSLTVRPAPAGGLLTTHRDRCRGVPGVMMAPFFENRDPMSGLIHIAAKAELCAPISAVEVTLAKG
jgi:hypothetical protein